MANRREFLEGFAKASVAAVVAGSGKWAFALPSFKADPALMMRARSLEFFDIAGSTLFPVYDPSGCLCADQVFYLMNRKSRMAIGVKLGPTKVPNGDILAHARGAVIQACRDWDKHASKVDFNGGPLPEAIRYEYKEIA